MVSESSITKLFGRSPFSALQKHGHVVRDCVHVMPQVFSSLLRQESDDLSQHIAKVLELEAKADEVKNDLRSHLPKSLFLPVDRHDLLDILDLQDGIADKCGEIVRILQERTMEAPEALVEPLTNYVTRCVDACDQASAIIDELDELLATGFRGRESETVAAMVDTLTQVETDTEKSGTELAKLLFSLENEMTPVSVVIWHDIIKLIGGLADYSKKVGNRLRLLMAR